MRVFITGATGFIGRRLADQLVRSGHEVTALSRRETTKLPRGITVRRGCLEDGPAKLAEVMLTHDVVFHLAGRVSFDSAQLPALLRTNSEGARTVLRAARMALVPRTVVVSSACTVGLSRTPDEILDEDAPFDPALEARNPYLCSKRLAERHALDAARSGQWVTIVNPTTVFGPGDDTLNSGTLVRQVAGARFMPVPPGGSNVVDVDDVVAGILAAAEHGRPGCRYILGGVNLAFREIIERIASAIGRYPRLVRLPSAARFPMTAAAWTFQRLTGSRLITPQIVADTFSYKFYSSARAEAELGWRAVRDFTKTLRAAWDYYRRAGLIAAPAGAVS